MNKYSRIMEHLRMEPDMKQTILDHLKHPEPEKKKARTWVRPVLVTACCVLALCLVIPLSTRLLQTGSGLYETADSASESVSVYDAGFDGAEMEEDASYSSSDSDISYQQDTSASRADSAKRIYTGTVDIESQEYETSRKELQELIESYGGFIQDESSSANTSVLPSSWYTVRIPTENYEAFFSALSEIGNITYTSKSAENITENYYNTEAKIESLEKERDRLNELMEQAEDISDIIAIEDKLSEIEQELQSWQQDLSAMDLDLDYSTVTVYLQSVQSYTDDTSSLGARLQSALSQTWSSFGQAMGSVLVFLIYALPWLLAAGLIVLIIRWIVRRKH